MMEDIQVDEFSEAVLSLCTLPLVVVYDNATKDYNGKYVARLWDSNKATRYVIVRDAIKEIKIPERLCVTIPRAEEDDPRIVVSFI